MSQQVLEIEAGGGNFEDVRELVAGVRGREVYDGGDTARGIWWAGMTQALIHDVPTVAALIERIITGAEAQIAGLSRLTSG